MAALDVRDRLAAEVPGLLRYARTIVRSDGRAEGLVPDTLLRALQRAGSFRGEASLTTWLHRILHNLAVDAAAVVEGAETREEFRDALVRLPTGPPWSCTTWRR